MEDFTKFPFGLPPTSVKAQVVNDILKKSFSLQRRLSMSNACAFVNTILQRCFQAAEIETDLIYGLLDRDKYIIPHIWLIIDGNIIDNTYVMQMSENEYVKLKTTGGYINKTPSESDVRYFLGDEDTRSLGTDDHNIKLFKWFLKNQDQALAMSFNKLQIKQYYKMLTYFMKAKYNVAVPHFLPSDNYC